MYGICHYIIVFFYIPGCKCKITLSWRSIHWPAPTRWPKIKGRLVTTSSCENSAEHQVWVGEGGFFRRTFGQTILRIRPTSSRLHFCNFSLESEYYQVHGRYIIVSVGEDWASSDTVNIYVAATVPAWQLKNHNVNRFGGSGSAYLDSHARLRSTMGSNSLVSEYLSLIVSRRCVHLVPYPPQLLA